MKFKDIKPFSEARYGVDIMWNYLEHWIDHHNKEGSTFDMDPDFQRAHVWSEKQQIRFVEFCLRGGQSGRQIYMNSIGWNHGIISPIVVVDGKQLLTAVLRFLRNEIPAFGTFLKDYEGHLSHGLAFRFNINDLPTHDKVIEWYLDLNDGGIAHTPEEIARVRNLLKEPK